jgi:hypothetical protein
VLRSRHQGHAGALPHIIPRGLPTESALAWIATGKYQYGTPLYRQAGLLRRFGGDISSDTIAASMVRVGVAIQPVITLMRCTARRGAGLWRRDGIPVPKEKGRKPQTKDYLWSQMTDSGKQIRNFTCARSRCAPG